MTTVAAPTAVVNLVVNQGDYWSQQITWKDSAGDLVDLTGYTAEMQARASASSTATVVDISDGDGITLGGDQGTILLELAATATAALAAGRSSNAPRRTVMPTPTGGLRPAPNR